MLRLDGHVEVSWCGGRGSGIQVMDPHFARQSAGARMGAPPLLLRECATTAISPPSLFVVFVVFDYDNDYDNDYDHDHDRD